MTDVDPELFYDAANGYKVDSDLAAHALTTLAATLDTFGAAGINGVGPNFASAYDNVSDLIGKVTSKLVNSFHNVGNVLQQNGINHDTTEQASVLNQRDSDGDPVTPPGYTEGTFLSAPVYLPWAGGGSKPEPLGWDIVGEQVTDGWPNGEPSKLTGAASAWEAFGFDVQDLGGASPAEMNLVANAESPEMPLATEKMNTTRNIAITAGTGGGDLARASTEYAAALTQAQDFHTTSLFRLWLLVHTPKSRVPSIRLAQEMVILAAKVTAVWHCNNINAQLRTTTENLIGGKGLDGARLEQTEALKKVDGLLGLTPRQVKPTRQEIIEDNRRRGARAEQRVGIEPGSGKKWIYPYENDPAHPDKQDVYRIPDILDEENHVLTDIKNVNRLAMTDQLRDMAYWASKQQPPYSMVFVVDNRTNVEPLLASLARDYPSLNITITRTALN